MCRFPFPGGASKGIPCMSRFCRCRSPESKASNNNSNINSSNTSNTSNINYNTSNTSNTSRVILINVGGLRDGLRDGREVDTNTNITRCML